MNPWLYVLLVIAAASTDSVYELLRGNDALIASLVVLLSLPADHRIGGPLWAYLENLGDTVESRLFRTPSADPTLALSVFMLLVRAEARDAVELCRDDLRRDVRQMLKEGKLSRRAIRLVILWRSLLCMVPIVWDAVVRLVIAVSFLSRVFRRLQKP